jgi:hypothetical protein
LPRGDLLILLRGSEAADLASFEVFASGKTEWIPWGLEPIDLVEQTCVGCLRLELVAEPEGDGILIRDAHERQVTIRMLSSLEAEPLVGTLIRDAVSGKCLDVDAIQINPWSRNFWRLTRTTSLDADAWWPGAPAGIHLLWIPEGESPPVPVQFEEFGID